MLGHQTARSTHRSSLSTIMMMVMMMLIMMSMMMMRMRMMSTLIASPATAAIITRSARHEAGLSTHELVIVLLLLLLLLLLLIVMMVLMLMLSLSWMTGLMLMVEMLVVELERVGQRAAVEAHGGRAGRRQRVGRR